MLCHMTKHEIKFVLHTPQAYFTFAKQIFHIKDISLIPKERISLKKTKSYDLVFFLAGAEGLEVAPQKHSRIARLERSHCSLFLHLTAVPFSATGGGTAVRPGTLRVPMLQIIRSKPKQKRHPQVSFCFGRGRRT